MCDSRAPQSIAATSVDPIVDDVVADYPSTSLGLSGKLAQHLDYYSSMDSLSDICNMGRHYLQPGAAAKEHKSGSSTAHVNTSLVWHTRKNCYIGMWREYADKKSKHILGPLELLSDGGLNVDEVGKLWDPDPSAVLSRYWSALNLSVLGMCSVVSVIKMDLDVICGRSDESQKGRFLVGGQLWNILGGEKEENGEQVVCAIELILLLMQLVACTWRGYLALFDDMGWDRWQSVSILFWSRLPFLSNFTAMKLLHFVNPAVLASELALQVSVCRERCQHAHYWLGITTLFTYVITRILCLLIGYDAFLVKVRAAMDMYINHTDVTIEHVYGGLLFLFQMLGVVNINLLIRARLFLFVFGGPDCYVDSHDKGTELFWNAMLARMIWERHGKFKFFVIMLSFSDHDFQHMFLHKKNKISQPTSRLAETSDTAETEKTNPILDSSLAESNSGSSTSCSNLEAPATQSFQKAGKKKLRTKRLSKPGKSFSDKSTITDSSSAALAEALQTPASTTGVLDWLDSADGLTWRRID